MTSRKESGGLAAGPAAIAPEGTAAIRLTQAHAATNFTIDSVFKQRRIAKLQASWLSVCACIGKPRLFGRPSGTAQRGSGRYSGMADDPGLSTTCGRMTGC